MNNPRAEARVSGNSRMGSSSVAPPYPAYLNMSAKYVKGIAIDTTRRGPRIETGKKSPQSPMTMNCVRLESKLKLFNLKVSAAKIARNLELPTLETCRLRPAAKGS